MKGFLRSWQEFDLEDVKKHLIVVGELSSDCFCCRKIGLDSHARACPSCKAYFKYMGFRRHVDGGYIHKLRAELPSIIFIDFDDFKKLIGQQQARKLLDI
ncbi:MAG: hypothetical protein ABH865_04135 [Candidatus Omnitrophota bacterium]